MRRLRLLLVIVLVAGLVAIPGSAQAQECLGVEGHGVFDFGVNEGRARLHVGGERQVVDFFSTGFVETGDNTADIRFVFFFDQGPLVIVEHSVGTPIGENLVFFDSDLDIKKGGSGDLDWYGIADLDAAVADIHHIVGEICFGR